MNNRSLTARLKEHALAHGIDSIGITSAEPFTRKGKTDTIMDPKKLLADAHPPFFNALPQMLATPSLIMGFPRILPAF